ncbi:hypothetical protein M422DRAFT_256478 [Sphaerobolus stellatus SS14]|uniref:EB1 C-terminal domain-containing protein n=1 Tax=Sphaerobolus stellatus (strain SS14) TaxID=990650 RepID=A0A0C9VRC9_SPHS4|nr:hypothetical protein M422DRAFT_256478 [Sphaerobolus stellatus SS14]
MRPPATVAPISIGGARLGLAGRASGRTPIGRASSTLRDIEILAQTQVEILEAEGKDDETLREIQKILYSTEVSDLHPATSDAFFDIQAMHRFSFSPYDHHRCMNTYYSPGECTDSDILGLL